MTKYDADLDWAISVLWRIRAEERSAPKIKFLCDRAISAIHRLKSWLERC